MKKTELTVQIFDNLPDILNLLKKQGFKQFDEFQLTDYYFSSLNKDVKWDYKTLIKNSFLLREVKTEDAKKYILCYKDKSIDAEGNVLTEQKTTTTVNDFNAALQIFNKSGLNNWCNLKQLNFGFKKGEIEFYVQIVDELGIFIEYEETKNMQNMSAEQKLKLMHSQLKQLNLNMGKDLSVKKVYIKYLKNFD